MVLYKGIKYSAGIKDTMKIWRVQLILVMKRVKRRMLIIIPGNISLYLLLTGCWLLFGIVVYKLGLLYYTAENRHTFVDVMWELKSSYFTSVLLALFINVYNNISEYKKKIRKQHWIYTDTMESFEGIFLPYIGDELLRYMPFYTEKCLDDTLKYIRLQNCTIKPDRILQDAIEDIKGYIDNVIDEIREDALVGISNKEMLLFALSDVKRKLRNLNNTEICFEDFRRVTRYMFGIIEEIRTPWRKDIKEDTEILKILEKYSKNAIDSNFYFSMLLYGHQFERENI